MSWNEKSGKWEGDIEEGLEVMEGLKWELCPFSGELVPSRIVGEAHEAHEASRVVLVAKMVKGGYCLSLCGWEDLLERGQLPSPVEALRVFRRDGCLLGLR